METHHERPVQLVFKRTEAKYLLARDQKERLCALMAGRMVPDEYGASTIRNLYLDTPSLIFARRSAEHPFYKEKLRIRRYAPAFAEDQVFLELKKKSDVVVYKRRCQLSLEEALALCQGRRQPQGQIEKELVWSAGREGGVSPVCALAYEQEAFYGGGQAVWLRVPEGRAWAEALLCRARMPAAAPRPARRTWRALAGRGVPRAPPHRSKPDGIFCSEGNGSWQICRLPLLLA